MSDTPRTDAAVKQILQTSQHERVKADFARELEREIALREEKYAEDYRDLAAAYTEVCFAADKFKNKLGPLEAENAELRSTHAGGQTGVECAELAAQNNTLRSELGKTLQERTNLWEQVQNLKAEFIRLRSQRQVS